MQSQYLLAEAATLQLHYHQHPQQQMLLVHEVVQLLSAPLVCPQQTIQDQEDHVCAH
jgi:hypothetical protein